MSTEERNSHINLYGDRNWVCPICGPGCKGPPEATAPTAHHPLGPSKFPAWAACPCFESDADVDDLVVMTDPEEHQDPTDAAARGTAQHAALAKALTLQPESYAGLTAKEEADARWVADKTIEEAAAFGYTQPEIRVEQRLTLFKGGGFEELYFGTADIEYGPVIADAKFGDPRNYFAQLAGYALAKMERDGLTGVFARAYYGRWRRAVTYTIDRQTAETVVYGILRKRQDPERKPSVCEFCGICSQKLTCTAFLSKVDVLLSKREDWAMRLPTMHLSQVGADPVLIGAMMWLWKTFVAPWGEAVEYAAKTTTEHGNVPLGFKKQDRRGSLTITDPVKAYDALVAAGVPAEALLAAADFSLKGLGEAYHGAKGGTKKAAPEEAEMIIVAAGAAHRGPAGFALIRQADAEDDIRAALARPATPQPQLTTQ